MPAARVRFTADFDFSPGALGGRVTIAYKAGHEGPVTGECAEAAVAAGRAEWIVKPVQPDPIVAAPDLGHGKSNRRRPIRKSRL